MSEAWYIVKREDGRCEIVTVLELKSSTSGSDTNSQPVERWGPFASEAEAIARRVGLIRSGKCQPN